jgi:hypothetical protein
VRRSCPGFQEFQTGAVSPEFLPYHFLCDCSKNKRARLRNEPRAFVKDIDVLREMTDCLWALNLTPSEHKNLAIGLYNTHFASLFNPNDATPVIRNDFLFLFYALVRNDITFGSFTPSTRRCLRVAVTSLEGKNPGTKMPESNTYMHGSYLFDFLSNNNIRI